MENNNTNFNSQSENNNFDSFNSNSQRPVWLAASFSCRISAHGFACCRGSLCAACLHFRDACPVDSFFCVSG